ncbi:hypothetical protein [Schnuerera sp.]|uniref:hypothetical protein n=1 Tax=Schnuerera sp. TaxID=2794844 RepID=UPI002C750273|nr:hypothetical protein [Schnuerera sp.]HSH36710.1 hypothetical protein [Schnuerera sp.]
MSIRPVDYTNLISKSQEISKIRQVENDKAKVHLEQGFAQHKKQIEKNIKKVRDTNKSENLIIDRDKKKGSENNKDGKKNKKEKKKGKRHDKSDIGNNIDIKI